MTNASHRTVPILAAFPSHHVVSRTLLAFVCALACAFATNSFADPGDLYVSDLTTNSIIVYKPDGTSSTFATGFNQPQGLVFDRVKNLYVADGTGNVYRVTPAGTKTVFVSGLVNPLGLAIVGGELLVAENGADRVTAITQSAQKRVVRIVSTPIGLASHTFSGGEGKRYISNGPSVFQVNEDGTSTDIAPGKDSINVASEPDTDVFVSTGNGEVLRITPEGVISTVASIFTKPTGLAVRPARYSGDMMGVGDLFVADPATGMITKLSKTSGASVFATGGKPNFLVFEVGTTDGTPTPTPTATPTPSGTPTPTPSGTPTPTPSGTPTPTPSGTPTPTPSGTPTPTPSGTPTPTPSASPTPTPLPSPMPGLLENISTRADVLTGDQVMIGGFIVTGTGPKKVILRAIGPSFSGANPPVADPLADPVLELHKPDGTIVTNDNWKDTQEAEIMATGLQPSNDLESAMVDTLDPVDPSVAGSGEYTAVLRGNNGGTGVAMVEIYDLDDPASTSAQLGNLSTRAFVGSSDNVLIGGFILGPDSADEQVLIRALGPSLPAGDVADPLADPNLEVFNADGDELGFNDNWKDTNESKIADTGLAPTNDKESAILANLFAGNYTAIVRGTDGAIGVALVEIYNLQPTQPVVR